MAQLKTKNLSQAESTFLKALKQDDTLTLTPLNLSFVYFHQGRYDKTDEELQQILAREPSHLQAKILRGRSLSGHPGLSKG